MPGKKAGVSVPLLIAKPARLALVDAARVTVRVYVLVVMVFDAVTATWIELLPTLKGIAADEVPDATETPFTFMVASGSAVVGLTVMEATPLTTATL